MPPLWMPFEATPDMAQPRLFLPCFELARNISVRTDTCASPLPAGAVAPDLNGYRIRRATLRRLVPASFPPQRARHRCRAVALAGAIVVAVGAFAGCGGGDDSKSPKPPHFTAKQNKGIETIATNVQAYCVKGGAHANIEREIDTLLTAYRTHPTAIYKNSQGTESTMREVVSAVADELEGCGEEAGAQKLRRELRGAG